MNISSLKRHIRIIKSNSLNCQNSQNCLSLNNITKSVTQTLLELWHVLCCKFREYTSTLYNSKNTEPAKHAFVNELCYLRA